jgi:hypothetical protein
MVILRELAGLTGALAFALSARPAFGLKDREAHAFHSWTTHAAEQESRTRVSWRAASAVVILDGCESGGHYMTIS